MVSAEEVEKKVKSIIMDKLGSSETQVTNDALLVEDLEADSLDKYELLIAFEDAFGIEEISDENAEKIKTVQDAIEYVKSYINKQK